jgi:hypothetical protein
MGVWHRSDQLKTLAFAIAGWGCWMSFSAASAATVFSRTAMLAAGFVLAMASVVVALFMGARDGRKTGPYASRP